MKIAIPATASNLGARVEKRLSSAAYLLIIDTIFQHHPRVDRRYAIGGAFPWFRIPGSASDHYFRRRLPGYDLGCMYWECFVGESGKQLPIQIDWL
jgi:hypothetical protein